MVALRYRGVYDDASDGPEGHLVVDHHDRRAGRARPLNRVPRTSWAAARRQLEPAGLDANAGHLFSRRSPPPRRPPLGSATMTAMTTFDLDQTDRLLTTTRAVRRRLDLDRPVERDVIFDCLRVALQAPTGGNRQGWRWLVVDDPDLRAGLATSIGRVRRRTSRPARPRWRRGRARQERAELGHLPR